ncbi:MAG: alpha/beta fold hydrolase, partial [Caulobacteraceae bacterium]
RQKNPIELERVAQMMWSQTEKERARQIRRRPTGVLALGWACLESAANGRTEHRPTSADWPDSVVRRISLPAGGAHPWRLSALVSPRSAPPPWKIAVVTGAPSWAEYWAPVIAALPADREMIVVDRPGFAGSEPVECVGDLEVQAEALAPLLETAPGQKLLLVGQSYGAVIAAIMAARAPGRVASLVLLSSYLGVPGPTARWLVGVGSRFLGVIPRDLRNAVMEVSGLPAQMPLFTKALGGISAPIGFIHGAKDDFAPIDVALQLALDCKTRLPVSFQRVPEANHFLNDGPPEVLLSALEACLPIPAKRPRWVLKWPSLGVSNRAATGLAASEA